MNDQVNEGIVKLSKAISYGQSGIVKEVVEDLIPGLSLKENTRRNRVVGVLYISRKGE